MKNQNIQTRLAVAAVLATASGLAAAQATGPDFSTLTGAVNFGTVGAAILAIAALMVVPKVVSWGAKKVMGFIRG